MIQIRILKQESDYSTLVSWWKGHGWPAIPAHVLPALGAMAEDDGIPVAAGFLYMDNSSPVCMLEWLVTRPDARPLSAMKAITAIVEFLKLQAIGFDYTVMLGATKTRSIGVVLSKAGFVLTDESVQHYLCVLQT